MNIDYNSLTSNKAKALRKYWRKFFDRSNISHFLSNDSRNKWLNTFLQKLSCRDNENTLPEFTLENVIATLKTWSESTETFLI